MPVAVSWVPPASVSESEAGSYDLYTDSEGLWVRHKWKQGGPDARLGPFYERWPPSRTSERCCAWIAVDRGPSPALKALPESEVKGDVEGLKAEFEAITSGWEDVEGAGEEDERKVTPEMIDVLAAKYGVLSGKWIIHTKSEHVDILWQTVVRIVTLDRGYGKVKVSARKVLVSESNPESQPHSDNPYADETETATWNGGTPDPQQGHIICIYVDDYRNQHEVDELRKALRLRAGVSGNIGFKTEAYTHLGIYKGNKWKLRPSRYHGSDNMNKATEGGFGKKSRGGWGGRSVFKPHGPVELSLEAK